MKKQSVRKLLLVIFLLIAVVSIPWYFTRPQTANPDGGRKPAAGSIFQTKTSQRPAPDSETERRRQASISAGAQKWYEELLEKYPQMKPNYRDVPDAENGFLQFLLLDETVKESRLPQELDDMFAEGSEWNSEKFKAWLDENQDYLTQILHVADSPGQSVKGIDFERIFNSARLSGEFGKILLGATRLAFESGDQESALRYAKAIDALGGHLTNVEVPSMLAEVIAVGYHTKLRGLFLEKFFPTLSDNPQALTRWQEIITPKELPSSEYSRILAGDWNVAMRIQILPTLLGAHTLTQEETSFQFSDSGEFIDLYTTAIRKFAVSLASAGPDRVNLSPGEFSFPESGIDPKTLKMLHDFLAPYRGLYQALGIQTTRITMISAAIAIQLGEEPPVDPVSGKPFRWDAESRTLSYPEGVEADDPIKLP